LFNLGLVLSPENAGFQIVAANYFSFFIIIFYLQVKPFKLNFMNTIEIINEATILFLSYFLLTFSDFNPDPQIKSSLGVFYCFCFSGCVGLNLSLMLKKSLYEPYKKRKLQKKLK